MTKIIKIDAITLEHTIVHDAAGAAWVSDMPLLQSMTSIVVTRLVVIVIVVVAVTA